MRVQPSPSWIMERLKKIVTKIASTPDSRLPELPLLHRCLLPLLSSVSSLYSLSLFFRRYLYVSGLFSKQWLPVPVISVGNLTWGGNGKTPMTEFITRMMDSSGIPALILSRGYAGGDEAKMLQRHLRQTYARIGVGANRSATAASMFERYGYMDSQRMLDFKKLSCHPKFRSDSTNEKIGVVILDDGMQHWSLLRDVEIVMINGLMPWGNSYLLPRGPLREPLSALGRADILVIHHADLVSNTQLECIESTIQKVTPIVPIFFSRLAPSFFFEVKNHHFKLPLSMVQNMVVLCVSSIGFPDAFIQGIRKIEPFHVDRLDFSDHHCIRAIDIDMIRERRKELQDKFEAKVIVVVTEKDYDRDPAILRELDEVFVLCSSLQIMTCKDCTEDNFRTKLKELLIKKMQRRGT